jgi:ankyrin repeat protein
MHSSKISLGGYMKKIIFVACLLAQTVASAQDDFGYVKRTFEFSNKLDAPIEYKINNDEYIEVTNYKTLKPGENAKDLLGWGPLQLWVREKNKPEIAFVYQLDGDFNVHIKIIKDKNGSKIVPQTTVGFPRIGNVKEKDIRLKGTRGISKESFENKFWGAVLYRDIPALQRMFEGRNIPNVNMRSESGTTPLMMAVKTKMPEHEAPTGQEAPSGKKATLDLAKFLIGKKADVNAKDKKGKTALFYALDNANMVEFLIAAGADVNIKDKMGKTPLEYVENDRDGKLVKKILLANAKTGSDSKGEPAQSAKA